MEKILPEGEALNKVTPLSNELPKTGNKVEADEIVLYDECGDTLWDRVLRQEENKLKISPSPKA